MATKVFISWSGDLSRKLGEALREWLPASLQYVKPYFSPEDVEKGAKWNTEIAKELESSDIGVICLTLDNTEKPWILFEAGALSKSIDKSRVCTLLFDIEPADVKGPLTSFQSTRFGRDDFKRLITTVNNSAGDAKLDAAVLESVFDMWWPKLEAKVQEILGSHDRHGEGERRSERDMLEEVLELTRMNASRQSRPPRVNERAIIELVETLDEMMFMAGRRGPDDLSYHLMRRLDRPLRQICVEVGMREVYDRHRMRMRTVLAPMEDRERLSEVDNEKVDE
ncbi:MAG: toll/interleukin-1 receptor domain-containing protein [Kiritimatiellae bacterium]|nr:toll/interleukin-1 receptor domain-containing protein [Kiritimatiellia bacterium]